MVGRTMCVEVTRIKVQAKIHQGAFSELYKCYRVSDHAYFALKRVYAAVGDEIALRSYLQEKMVL